MNSIPEVKHHLQKSGIRGLALDIDNTLTPTNAFWVEQLQCLYGNPEGLTVTEIVEKYGYAENVPYWNTAEARAWMQHHRESNQVQESLPLIENVNAVVEELVRSVPVVTYLTSRPEGVREGTREWLVSHNFPEAPLLMRPTPVAHEEGRRWKAETLSALYPEVVGIVDDDAMFLSFLPMDYAGKIFLYNHVHIPRTKVSVVACKTWKDVAREVKNHAMSDLPQ